MSATLWEQLEQGIVTAEGSLPVCEFEVAGIPQQQGSKTIANHGGRQWVRDANEAALKPWRLAIASAAAEAWAGRPLLLGAVRVAVSFGFPRPRDHYRADGTLKPSAPRWKISAPDTDKLQRALGDALTGIVYVDDRQIAQWGDPSKVYVDPPVTRVRVEVLA